MGIETQTAESPAPRWKPFARAFVPFALLLSAGNLYAETQPNLALGRVIVTIWLTFAFALPAVILFGLYGARSSQPLAFRYWQVFWGFAFLAYALHFYVSVFIWFDADWPQIVRRQTAVVAYTNVVLLVVWGLDALIGLFGSRAGGTPGVVVRWAAHLLLVVSVFTSAIVFRKSALSMALAVAITGGFLLAVLCRVMGGMAARKA